jgi:phosphatidylethanolamine-binding protein (PEBP) family uncharacterized protein
MRPFAPTRRRPVVVVAACLLALTACSQGDGRQLADPDPDDTRVTTTAPTAAGAEARGGAAPSFALPVQLTGARGLQLTTSAFEPGAEMGGEYTCEGAGQPPPLTWTGTSPQAAELALVVRDADADGAVHWLMTDIPPSADGIDGSAPAGATERQNDFGVAGWSPPCPPSGSHHRYVFVLYERTTPLEVTGAEAPDIIAELERDGDAASTIVGIVTPPD